MTNVGASGLCILLAKLEGCEATRIDDPAAIERALRDAVRAADYSLKQIHVHRFQPHGRSGIAVIGESHIAVHTWPETGEVIAEVMSCSTLRAASAALEVLCDAFSPTTKTTQHVTVSDDGSFRTPTSAAAGVARPRGLPGRP